MKAVTTGMFFVAVIAVAASAQTVVPLQRAHAHNDYEHTRPLLDALDQGFCSFEADVWLVDGELLVAHDPDKTSADRTLEGLYLKPLAERAAANKGRIYKRVPAVQLLIDIKSEAEPAYRAIREALLKHESFLTIWENGKTTLGGVTVVISGNRPKELMLAETKRVAFYDGRIDDMRAAVDADFMPLVSDDWTKWFTWKGTGRMPKADSDRLAQLVEAAHARKVKLRFWGAPDVAPIWKAQFDANVDWIGTDRLEVFQKFMLDEMKAKFEELMKNAGAPPALPPSPTAK